MRVRAAISAVFLFICAPLWAQDKLRVAVFDAELRRTGPGVLLRDLSRGKDAQVAAAVQVIATAQPDVLALLSFDWDHDAVALTAFADLLAEAGMTYPYRFSARPNSGWATDLDLDGDGRRGGPGDAQGYGDYTGQGGLAILSVRPILTDQVQDFSTLLWRELPGALLPHYPDGRAFPSQAAQAVQRLSSTSHWAVPVALADGSTVTILTFHATPPVFDGAEDRNGRRNHDEVTFWRHYLDGAFGQVPDRFVLAGGSNLDPFDSDGRGEAMRDLLGDPRLQDPKPASPGALETKDDHRGPPALDTVDWDKIGRFRVDYVLPSAGWTILDAGVIWPPQDGPLREAAETASRHRLVWVDLALP